MYYFFHIRLTVIVCFAVVWYH